MIKVLSIIIPVYNEQRTIAELLDKVQNLQLVHNVKKEIIIVDDCSNDKSREIIERCINKNGGSGMKFHSQEKNQGNGAAIHYGISNATGDYTIIQDADLELNPEDINLLIAEAIKGKANVIYGSRFINKTHLNTSFWWHIVGNKVLSKVTAVITGYNFTDMMTCYKLVPLKFLKQINLVEKRFGFEPEVTVKLSKLKEVKFAEVGISYNARTREDGKKINWKDGIKVLNGIIKYRFFD